MSWEGTQPAPFAVQVIGYASTGSDVGSIGTTEVNVLTVTIPRAMNGAVYRVTFPANGFHSTAGSTLTLRTKWGALASTGGTLISESILTCATASRRYPATLVGHFTYTGTDGATNINVVAVAVASVAGGTVSSSFANTPLYVERIA